MLFNKHNEECIYIKNQPVSFNAIAQALKIKLDGNIDEYFAVLGIEVTEISIGTYWSGRFPILAWEERTQQERNLANKLIKRLSEIRVFDREATAKQIWKGQIK